MAVKTRHQLGQGVVSRDADTKKLVIDWTCTCGANGRVSDLQQVEDEYTHHIASLAKMQEMN